MYTGGYDACQYRLIAHKRTIKRRIVYRGDVYNAIEAERINHLDGILSDRYKEGFHDGLKRALQILANDVKDVGEDTDEQCVRCKGNCGYIGMTGEWACHGFVPMTNADRIRSMTDEELGKWMQSHAEWCPPGDCCEDCLNCWPKWLKEEAKP